VQSDDEKGAEVCEKLREEYGEDCVKMYGEFGPLIGTHVGKGAYAVLCRVATEVK
jgi:fatty acid-binding protein DegV